MSSKQELKHYPITHAHLNPVFHPELKTKVMGRSAVRYLRFLRKVRVDRLELGRIWARSIPTIPAHPARIIVSVLNPKNYKWRVIHEIDLPPDPRIDGKGITHKMPYEQIEDFFRKVMQAEPWKINLGGIKTDHLRVECDWEHLVYQNHGEYNGGPFNVPFRTLDNLKAYGEYLEEKTYKPLYAPLLKLDKFAPKAPAGMRIEDRPDMILFQGKKLSVGFSLRRPLIMHLGWDILGERALNNRLLCFVNYTNPVGLSGPLLRTLQYDCYPQFWTGNVSVIGNKVVYSGLRIIPDLTINASFTVESEKVTMELEQTCKRDIPVLEAEAWRFGWDLKAGITGTAVKPSLESGRSGDAAFPAMWASDGVGCLECRLLEGNQKTARLQVESWRMLNIGVMTGGFLLVPRVKPDEMMVLGKGKYRAVYKIRVANLSPKGTVSAKKIPAKVSEALARHWASTFSCFRPEFRGFSNHSASTNCHVNQHLPIDIASFTGKIKLGVNPVDLARFTIGTAILDGGGYGYFRNLYLDSDPCLISSTGRIHQMEPDLKWLKKIEPGLNAGVKRMLNSIGNEGLVVCRDLTGNSGSYRWSTNAMDVIGFGHIDAYSNALTYRALRNASALFAELKRKDLSGICHEKALMLRAAYEQKLVNPETGWVAAWLSRDGQLHDHANLFVNGPALAFGLLEPEKARKAVANLEALRKKVGLESARLGLPVNLLPIPDEDHMLPRISGAISQTFEMYTNGGMLGQAAAYYLRALSLYGSKAGARKMAGELAEGFVAGMFTGGHLTGHEFLTWNGIPCGYEGTLINSLTPMYSIAVEFGIIKPTSPEWWLQN